RRPSPASKPNTCCNSRWSPQAEADLAAKTAKASFASADAVRYRNLAKTGYGTQQSAERTSAADQEAQSTIKAAEAALDRAAMQRETKMRATVVEREDLTTIMHDEQRTGAAAHHGHAAGFKLR